MYNNTYTHVIQEIKVVRKKAEIEIKRLEAVEANILRRETRVIEKVFMCVCVCVCVCVCAHFHA